MGVERATVAMGFTELAEALDVKLASAPPCESPAAWKATIVIATANSSVFAFREEIPPIALPFLLLLLLTARPLRPVATGLASSSNQGSR